MAVSNAQLPARARSTRYLPLVVAWQVAIVAILLLVSLREVWGFVVASAVLLLMLLLTVPVNGRTLLSTMAIRSHFAGRAKQATQIDVTGEVLAPLLRWMPRLNIFMTTSVRGEEVGVVADGDACVGILELVSDDALIVDRGVDIDLETLPRLTRQDDIVFAGIQLLTLTVPAPNQAMLTPHSPAAQAYLETTGDAPTPAAVRRTWVALRLDPRLCLEAVDRRGSGHAGVMATLRFGLHRAQAHLKRQGVVARVLDPVRASNVFSLLVGADDSDGESVETWEQWRHGSLIHETRGIASFGPRPAQTYQQLLDSVAQAPAAMVVTSFTVCPGEPARGAIRQVTATGEAADAADEGLIGELGGLLKFGPLGGVQVPGLSATLPLGRQVRS